MTKASFYIDGFNLYHAIDDLNQPHLKWLDLRAFCRRLMLNRGVAKEIARIVYCTAISSNTDKAARHHQYIKALEYTGVEVLKGHFSHEHRECRADCKLTWRQPTEKRSDIHLALSLFQDACETDTQEFYLVTTDGDQAATAEFFKRRTPNKKLITVAPPGRDFNQAIRSHADGKMKVTVDMLEECLFPINIIDAEKGVIARAPTAYHPPAGWIAPRNRPK